MGVSYFQKMKMVKDTGKSVGGWFTNLEKRAITGINMNHGKRLQKRWAGMGTFIRVYHLESLVIDFAHKLFNGNPPSPDEEITLELQHWDKRKGDKARELLSILGLFAPPRGPGKWGFKLDNNSAVKWAIDENKLRAKEFVHAVIGDDHD